MTLKSVLPVHITEKGNVMNIDLGQLNPLLNQLQFPISKDELIRSVQQKGASNEVVSQLQRLPDKTFNSLQDVQSAIGGLGNIGGIKL
jgi:hypothetical protein